MFVLQVTVELFSFPQECAVVDPVEPKKVFEEVKTRGFRLTTALVTHHHWDHAGGNKELLATLPPEFEPLMILGGDDRIDGVTRKVTEGDEHRIGALHVRCMFTPCHTRGHICYFVTSTAGDCSPAVFTGDTLFQGGCGRFFEGNAEEMYKALVKALGSLPEETLVYCGHEYSVRNLEFGLAVEPENEAIANRLSWARSQIAAKKHTIPSTIAEEKAFNVFMRVGESSVQKAMGTKEAIETMHELRERKNNF